MIEAERTPGFLHLLQMTGGASWLHMCIHHRETEGFLSSATGLDKLYTVSSATSAVLLGARPARVVDVIDTGLPRPRPAHLGADPRFVALKEHLWDRVKALSTTP